MRLALAVLALALAGCHASSQPKPAVALTPGLDACEDTAEDVRQLVNIRTPKMLAQYANRLEISREMLQRELRTCNAKRQTLYDILGK
jgi:hypothetical protein